MKTEFHLAVNRIQQLERKAKESTMVLTGLTPDTSDTKMLTETMSNLIEKRLKIKPQVEIAYKKACLIELDSNRDKAMGFSKMQEKGKECIKVTKTQKNASSKIGMWKVKSLIGKEEKVVKEVQSINLDCIRVTETKKEGTEIMELTNI
ncbi:hypothetical protein ILUMI_07886 [Ignelater luminosus]|uniref:Uncharacterized protein n=1 Tax=Ignelater luminosus TaxID=2038154 RepID=A0A8K0D771_IGNLU|nr:hypothetical protein ILUMI_07886 [Ignelater luminosus]